ncbi:aminoacyltransferase [Catenisphaera adipataccumulans]|uniref:Aminoacyltransferase FemA n=1 Tax=Catenisphaera adipataccumulans TaxID=700500 RepID=A0A7W8CWP4_9FIRM|nr:aminoacyltransferase [Catenisphaera adipataccumulans]MBB5182953.1 peptidoglycan pentaglycine glycine transferase (the second and third glycine) [Catenisphaera adipataccumulans]
MMEFVNLTEAEYRSFWEQYPNRTFLNSPESAALKKKENWKTEFVGVKENGSILCAALISSIPVMKVYRYFYVQRGFLIDYSDRELLKFFTDELVKYTKNQKGLYILADPYVLYKERDINGELVEGGFDNSYVIENMEACGFEHQPFIRSYDGGEVKWMFSLYLDGKDEKTLLKEMHQQTRWSVNRTRKEGVQVRELADDEMDIFYTMMTETAERRHFETRDRNFFKLQKEIYGDHVKVVAAYLDVSDYLNKLAQEKDRLDKEMAEIDAKLAEVAKSKKFLKRQRVAQEALDLNAKKTKEAQELMDKYGEIVYMASAVFTIYDNEVVYLFSATHDQFRKYYAPYAIQWYMIRYALEHRIPRYNFYGISGNFSEDADDYGVYMFKKGFNGVVEQLVGDFIYPLRKGAYSMYKSLKK